MKAEQHLGGQSVLLGEPMVATIGYMPKTEQVRVPCDLMHDVRIIAAANNEAVTDYVKRVLIDSVTRDMPDAARKVAERAGSGDEKKPRRKTHSS